MPLCRHRSGPAWSPGRHEAISRVAGRRLITRGVSDPTACSPAREYRLQLREDNADMRLTAIGRELGVIDDARWSAFNRKRDAVARETGRLKSTWVNPAILPAAAATRLIGQPIEHEYSLFELLRRPNLNYTQILALPGGGVGEADARVAPRVEIAANTRVISIARTRKSTRAREQESLQPARGSRYGCSPGVDGSAASACIRHVPKRWGWRPACQMASPRHAISVLRCMPYAAHADGR